MAILEFSEVTACWECHECRTSFLESSCMFECDTCGAVLCDECLPELPSECPNEFCEACLNRAAAVDRVLCETDEAWRPAT